jgi:polysaccharide biosynthesis protein PelC
MTLSPRLPVLFAAALLCACGGGRQYVRPDADLSTIRTVSVLPFENVTNDRFAAERVQRIFLSELLMLGIFEVVEPGLAARVVRRDSVDVGTLGPDEIRKLGKELKAQGLFIGSVIEFDEGRSGSNPAPRVTLQVRLVDVETGITVWSIHKTAGGVTVTSRLFGFGGKAAMTLAEELIRSQLRELAF